MLQIAVLATLALAISAAPAAAQQAECIQNDQFLVIGQPRSYEVGTDFIIRPPSTSQIACFYEENDGDVIIRNPGDPVHFERLLGQYLVLTRSTGPDGDLVIYDLATDPTAPLVDLPVDDEMSISRTEIVFWERTVEGTEANCPQYAENSGYGFGSVILEERVFDVATGAVSATGNSRCGNTQ